MLKGLQSFWKLKFREFGEFYKPKKLLRKIGFLETYKSNMSFQMLWAQPTDMVSKIPNIKNSSKRTPIMLLAF